MIYLPVVAREECERRLRLIYPRPAFRAEYANPLGGCAVAALIYVGAIVEDDGLIDSEIWARPSTVLWMMDEVLQHDTDEERWSWLKAARRSKKAVAALLAEWGIEHRPWRADTTREPLRDETWPAWLHRGAMRLRPGNAKSHPHGVWALTRSFAELFHTELVGDQLLTEIEEWQDSHLNQDDLVKLHFQHERDEAQHAVSVTLPNGLVRHLEPGDASLIIKGVVEEWATRRLAEPHVLTISQPGDKIYVSDSAVLTKLGIAIDVNDLLPDAVIIDTGSGQATYWIVEAVASAGPITEVRRQQLLDWAGAQGLNPESCRFLSAFLGRDDKAARKHLADLAVHSYAWYADEPTRELSWSEIKEEARPDNVRRLRRPR